MNSLNSIFFIWRQHWIVSCVSVIVHQSISTPLKPLWNQFMILQLKDTQHFFHHPPTTLPPLATTYHGVMLSSVHHWNWITYQNTTDKCFVLNSCFCLQSEQIVVKNYTENILRWFRCTNTKMWWYHWILLRAALMISLSCIELCIWHLFFSSPHCGAWGLLWDEIDLFFLPRESKFGFKWCWTFFPSRCSDDIWEVHETQLNPTVRFFKTVFYFIWRKTIKTRV